MVLCGCLEIVHNHLQVVLFQDHGQVPVSSQAAQAFLWALWSSQEAQEYILSPLTNALGWFHYEHPHLPPSLCCFCVLAFLFLPLTQNSGTHSKGFSVVQVKLFFTMMVYFMELTWESTSNSISTPVVYITFLLWWEESPGICALWIVGKVYMGGKWRIYLILFNVYLFIFSMFMFDVHPTQGKRCEYSYGVFNFCFSHSLPFYILHVSDSIGEVQYNVSSLDNKRKYCNKTYSPCHCHYLHHPNSTQNHHCFL